MTTRDIGVFIKPLRKIRSGFLSRGLGMAKISLSAGAKAAAHTLANLVGDEKTNADRLRSLLTSQAENLVKELGQLKGSVMKVGQALSMVGEHFLPPEAMQALKKLQFQSPPLQWSEIEKQLKRELSADQLAQLEIDQTPLASASIGQVHKARVRATGQEVAIKVQYPGVDEAIDSDLKTLRGLFSLFNLIPQTPKTDAIFDEVRMMLKQEADYRIEANLAREYKSLLKVHSHFVIPDILENFSSRRVLTMTYEEGFTIDSPEVASLPQERRNRLAESYLDLFFKELYVFQLVQTDPHFGNYRVRISDNHDQLVLLDFGAVRKLEDPFLSAYKMMVAAAARSDRAGVIHYGEVLGFLKKNDDPKLQNYFAEICFLMSEPFSQEGDYDWGQSDLPKRLAQKLKELALNFFPRTPPRENVFLDRKLAGAFTFLAALKAKTNSTRILEKYL